jgi:RNA polymerase primary sigma factor
VTPLKPQAQIELAARIKKGDRRAREIMIKSSLPLVVRIAREYEEVGLPLLDLVSEGNLGVLKAVERFDPTKGAEFPACILWWVRQSIKRAVAEQPKTNQPRHLSSRQPYVC